MAESENEQADPTPEIAHDQTEPGPAESRPEMPAHEALARIAEGKPVEGVRVRKLRLRGEFGGPVVFKNCVLTQPEFGAAAFKDDLTLVGCTLDRPVFSRPVVIEGNFGLNGCTVNKAMFFQLTVKGKVFFSGARFKGKLMFEKCDFQQKVSWWEASIGCWAEFKGCGFAQEADFRSIHCDQGLIFSGCTFTGDFLLRGAMVAKKVQADGCRFEAVLDVSKAKLHDFVYLEGIEQGPGMRFAFANAVAERLLVRPDQVEGRLASELAGRHTEAMHEYGLLKKCYQGLHRFEAEDWAFYRFKVSQRRAVPCTWGRPLSKVRRFFNWLFLDIGCGYGTNPVRAVRMAAVIILGFAALYAVDVDSFYAEKVPFPGEPATAWPNRAMIGLTTSVAVFTSGMGAIREVAKGW
ncbi:MAG: hypothetical protein JWO38_6942, partial [Gemmataceae bacterium]|nr:hypothetical protein [Gemmataceae bacterium]